MRFIAYHRLIKTTFRSVDLNGRYAEIVPMCVGIFCHETDLRLFLRYCLKDCSVL